ncbi:MAG: thermonuclease family protein [Acidobacteria bacterium]|nr:thermonuclease family protein [Acidobacteriota bacterium]
MKVRLAGIDAPERGQDLANRSKQSLFCTVFGKQIILEGEKIDRYGRLVAMVELKRPFHRSGRAVCPLGEGVVNCRLCWKAFRTFGLE